MTYVMTRDELYHHGIKGQHWGQRRWQNEDGSLTSAGREHYGYGKGLFRNTRQMNIDRNNAYKTYKADLKAAKKEYKNKLNKSYDRESKFETDVEKNYKKGQKLTDKDFKKEQDYYNKESAYRAKAKSDYQLAKRKASANYTKNSEKIAKDFYSNSKYTDYGKGIALGLATNLIGSAMMSRSSNYGTQLVGSILSGAGAGIATGSAINIAGKYAHESMNKSKKK